MKLAVITPPQFSEVVGRLGLGYHMALATYCNDPYYIGHYKRQVMKGAFVILDNGAAEHGESLPFDEVVSIGEFMGADEIVMPDALGNMNRTLELTETWADLVPKRNRMVVPQGSDWAEWTLCARRLVKMGCHTIAIPKIYESFKGGRAYALKFIAWEGWHVTHDIHLLGCYKDPMGEVLAALETSPWVRGIDTGAPIAHAQVGVPMDYQQHVSLEWDAHAPRKRVVDNITTLLQTCNGGQPCMLP